MWVPRLHMKITAAPLIYEEHFVQTDDSLVYFPLTWCGTSRVCVADTLARGAPRARPALAALARSSTLRARWDLGGTPPAASRRLLCSHPSPPRRNLSPDGGPRSGHSPPWARWWCSLSSASASVRHSTLTPSPLQRYTSTRPLVRTHLASTRRPARAASGSSSNTHLGPPEESPLLAPV